MANTYLRVTKPNGDVERIEIEKAQFMRGDSSSELALSIEINKEGKASIIFKKNGPLDMFDLACLCIEKDE